MAVLDRKVNFLLRTINNIYKSKRDRQAQANDVDKVVDKLYDTIDAINNEVNLLNGRTIQHKYYEVVSGASSGNTVAKPTNATIELNRFGSSGDAILSTVDGNSIPTWESPRDAGGSIVTASIIADGTYTFSSTPTDSNVAIIYAISISQSDSITDLNQTYIIDETELKPREGDESVTVEVSTNYNATAGDFVVMTTGAGDKTVTLPSSPSKDDVIDVYKYDNAAGKVIIDGNGNNVDFGSQAEILLQGESHTYQFTGTEWLIK